MDIYDRPFEFSSINLPPSRVLSENRRLSGVGNADNVDFRQNWFFFIFGGKNLGNH